MGDIDDAQTVADTIAEYPVESIAHFAADKNAGESFQDPGRYFTNNVAGTARLLDTAQRSGVKRIVFSSTRAVYGTPERTPVGEDAPIHPESPYGESKALVERMLAWYSTCHGMDHSACATSTPPERPWTAPSAKTSTSR